MDPFHPLKTEDIEEKVQICIKKGFSLEDVQAKLLAEKNLLERARLLSSAQIQNLTEQIQYVELKIKNKES
jgi:hypothetical protein